MKMRCEEEFTQIILLFLKLDIDFDDRSELIHDFCFFLPSDSVRMTSFSKNGFFTLLLSGLTFGNSLLEFLAVVLRSALLKIAAIPILTELSVDHFHVRACLYSLDPKKFHSALSCQAVPESFFTAYLGITCHFRCPIDQAFQRAVH